MADQCLSDDKLLVNWDSIDINLLELVAKKLDVTDNIRFRTVCKTWRSIPIASKCRRLLPWLITGWDRDEGRLFYVSFTDGKLHSVAVPALKENKRFELGIVSCEGWLVLEGQQNCYTISLLNPLTDTLLHLPEAPKQLFARRIQYNMHFDPLHATVNYIEIPYLVYQMAISNPDLLSTSTAYTIVVISAGNKALVSLRKGDDGYSWRLMNDKSKYEDVVFFQKYFVAVDCLGQISVFSDINLNKLFGITSPSTALNKADWKLSKSPRQLLLFQKISELEGYISFKGWKFPFYKTKKLPLYKTRSIEVYEIFQEDFVSPPPPSIKFITPKYQRYALFYGLSSAPYLLSKLLSSASDLIYIAGEHVKMPDDDVTCVAMPQTFNINNATLKPLFPEAMTNTAVTIPISLWHMPRP